MQLRNVEFLKYKLNKTFVYLSRKDYCKYHDKSCYVTNSCTILL